MNGAPPNATTKTCTGKCFFFFFSFRLFTQVSLSQIGQGCSGKKKTFLHTKTSQSIICIRRIRPPPPCKKNSLIFVLKIFHVSWRRRKERKKEKKLLAIAKLSPRNASNFLKEWTFAVGEIVSSSYPPATSVGLTSIINYIVFVPITSSSSGPIGAGRATIPWGIAARADGTG